MLYLSYVIYNNALPKNIVRMINKDPNIERTLKTILRI
jgi:hypothetical protein